MDDLDDDDDADADADDDDDWGMRGCEDARIALCR